MTQSGVQSSHRPTCPPRSSVKSHAGLSRLYPFNPVAVLIILNFVVFVLFIRVACVECKSPHLLLNPSDSKRERICSEITHDTFRYDVSIGTHFVLVVLTIPNSFSSLRIRSVSPRSSIVVCSRSSETCSSSCFRPCSKSCFKRSI